MVELARAEAQELSHSRDTDLRNQVQVAEEKTRIAEMGTRNVKLVM